MSQHFPLIRLMTSLPPPRPTSGSVSYNYDPHNSKSVSVVPTRCVTLSPIYNIYNITHVRGEYIKKYQPLILLLK